MDYRRAQRNLALINENADINDNIQQDMEQGNYEDDEDNMISTQVPSIKFSQSSVSSMDESVKVNSSTANSPTKQSPVRYDTDGIVVEKPHMQTLIETANEEENVNHIPEKLIASPAKTGSHIEDEEVFISTQVQGRLDEFEHDKEMKGKLTQFRFESNDTKQHLEQVKESEPIVNRPAIRQNRKSREGHATKRQKTTKENGHIRAQNLLEKLSGKHKKVKDIINRKSKKTNSKPTVEKYDVYNADEWKAISASILSQFPKSSTQDVKDVFSYLYGSNKPDEMWDSSQKPPLDLLSPERSASEPASLPAVSSQEPIGTMRLLSLSQVMGDTSRGEEKSLEIVNEQPTQDNDTNESSLYVTQENVIEDISEDESPELKIVDVLEYDNGNVKSTKESTYPTIISDSDNEEKGLSFHIIERQYPGNETDMSDLPEVISPNKKEKDALILSENASEDESVICDSMDETATIFPEIRDEDIEIFKKSIRPVLAPPTGIPSLRRKTTELSEDIIDLTQQSYKAVAKLISPLKKDDIEESSPSMENPRPEQTQVSATRAPTVISMPLQTSPDQDDFIIRARLSDGTCKKIRTAQLPFDFPDSRQFMSEYQNAENEVVYDSDYSDPNGNPQIGIFDVKCHEIAPQQIITSPSKSEDNIITSQSVQELRSHIREIGLKPARSKTQMVELLEVASQVLTQGDEPVISSRTDVYNHLTRLLYRSPALLEKARLYQPILMDDFLLELIEMDSFVSRIDESTVQSWADDNGVSLKRS